MIESMEINDLGKPMICRTPPRSTPSLFSAHAADRMQMLAKELSLGEDADCGADEQVFLAN
jgi:hypothetical protein